MARSEFANGTTGTILELEEMITSEQATIPNPTEVLDLFLWALDDVQKDYAGGTRDCPVRLSDRLRAVPYVLEGVSKILFELRYPESNPLLCQAWPRVLDTFEHVRGRFISLLPDGEFRTNCFTAAASFISPMVPHGLPMI